MYRRSRSAPWRATSTSVFIDRWASWKQLDCAIIFEAVALDNQHADILAGGMTGAVVA